MRAMHTSNRGADRSALPSRADPAPDGSSIAVPKARPRLLTSFLLVLLSACTPTHEETIPPLGDDVRSEISAVNVATVTGSIGARHGTVQPISPGEAAGMFVLGSTSEATSGAPILLPLGLAIGILGAPIAAAAGSISPREIQQAEHELNDALADASWQGRLREDVAAPIGARYKVSEDSDVHLTLVLFGPFLEVAKDRTAQPLLRVRGILSKDGTCLSDRYWAWNGKSGDFFDLAENKARRLRERLSEGMKELGIAVAQDLFLSHEPRKVQYRNGTTAAKDRPIMIERAVDYEDTLASWLATVNPDYTTPCAVESAPESNRFSR